MGCDIHLFVEAKNNKTGKWEYKPYAPEYGSRNYDVFGMLANVRNGWGIAGIITGFEFNVIALPRGIPQDVSPKVQEENEQWNDNGYSHGHSFLTLKELIEYDWEQVTKRHGVVNSREYMDAKENKGEPKRWCVGVAGRKVKLVSNKKMDKVILAGDNNLANYYTVVKWEELYKDRADSFYSVFLPELKEFAKSSNLSEEDVRIVFWFDN